MLSTWITMDIKMLSRRNFLISSLLATAAAPAFAQTFPGALIRIVVPAAPGGGTDILARAMSQQLATGWGQTVIVENRSGGGGLIGTRQAIAAPPDGHTLLMAATSAIMSLAVSKGGLPFEIASDLAPVTLVSAPPYILVAHPSVPAKNAAELIDYAKKNPGKLSYGSSGSGAASHLSGALFAQMAGLEMLHVPYRGMGPAVPDLLGGRIQLLFAPAITVTPHITAGTLRMIGTTGATRSKLFPDFPTIAESGLPNYNSLGWFGLFAPGATPSAMVERISGDVRKVLESDDLKKRLAEQGAEPEPTTPAQFKDFVNSDIRKWLDLAQKAGIKLGGG
jgi:tripartite-type tricarboxylate transporter receptor subunit TctC